VSCIIINNIFGSPLKDEKIEVIEEIAVLKEEQPSLKKDSGGPATALISEEVVAQDSETRALEKNGTEDHSPAPQEVKDEIASLTKMVAPSELNREKSNLNNSDHSKSKLNDEKPIFNHYPHGVGKDLDGETVTIPRKRINYLVLKARSLLLVDELQEAHNIAQIILRSDPNNKQAQAIETYIQQKNLETDIHGANNIEKTRDILLKDVRDTWQIPKITVENIQSQEEREEWSDTFRRLNRIIIPKISFHNTPLSQAIDVIANLAETYDKEQNSQSAGVNVIVIATPNEAEPAISLSLRNMPLDKILNFIAKASTYQFDIEDDVIVFRKSEGDLSENLETKFFKISRSAIIRMTGIRAHNIDNIGNKDKNDKKAVSELKSVREEERLIKEFLQRAGVNFAGIKGSSLAYDGSQLIVTQSLRNIKRVKEILSKYEQVKQVEIETKFIEIQQGKLDELQFDWNMNFAWRNTSGHKTHSLTTHSGGNHNLRRLTDAFSIKNASGGDGSIVFGSNNNTPSIPPIPIPSAAPSSPGGINLGTSAVNLGNFAGVINDKINLGLTLRALEQQSNSDLMSAPKLTVLSGKTAKIIVAQEFIYPKTYGEIKSEVGTGDANSAGVTITAGTPSDFETRNVGVEMNVTPIVEENHCISLQLAPRVTEFEGFIEYGGRSIAIQGNTTVDLPPGFFQPIFSTREIQTEVTIYDGATVVMGGLTREEIKEVHDKIPLLGDIPFIGKLFRSKGETSQKKNLLIFVTANILSPSGTPARTHHREPKQEPPRLNL
jgi:general secretion pathway protein D